MLANIQCLILKPISADTDNMQIISCIPTLKCHQAWECLLSPTCSEGRIRFVDCSVSWLVKSEKGWKNNWHAAPVFFFGDIWVDGVEASP